MRKPHLEPRPRGGARRRRGGDGTPAAARRAADPRLREGQPEPRRRRQADGRHRQPRLPALVRRRRKKKPWKVNDPTNGKGFESAVAYAVASSSASRRAEVAVDGTCPSTTRTSPGKKHFDFDINQISFTPQRAQAVDFSKAYYFVNQARRRPQGHADRRPCARSTAQEVQARRPDRDDELRLHHRHDQAELEAARLRHERRGRAGAEDGADRRARRRPADGVLRHRRAGAGRQGRRPVRLDRHEGALRAGLPEGQLADLVRQQGARRPWADGTLEKIQRIWLAKATGAPVLK